MEILCFIWFILKNNIMEDKLITLVTLTYSKAEILKSVLESEGIMAELYNINVIQPFVASGVKVKINEKDLPRALEIVTNGSWLKEDDDTQENKNVLVPVDFSDQSLMACCFAFDYAASIGAEVYLLHVFFPPVYSSMLPFENEVNTIQEYRMVLDSVKEKMADLVGKINKMIENKELPDISFKDKIYEGVAEEEILHFASKKKSSLIVMGTRNKDPENKKVLGSVAAEVMERASTTVVAIPEDTPYLRFSGMKRIAFMTNLDKRDLISFDSLYDIVKVNGAEVILIHIADENNDWSKVKLSGFKQYLNDKYPDLKVEIKMMMDDGNLTGIDNLIKEMGIDAISMTKYRRTLFSRMMTPSMTKRVFFKLDTPLIVFNKK